MFSILFIKFFGDCCIFSHHWKEKFSEKETSYDKIEDLTFEYLELCKTARLQSFEDEGVLKSIV